MCATRWQLCVRVLARGREWGRADCCCAPAPTSVSACWDEQYLRLVYVASDDKCLRNDYTACNTDMWNQVGALLWRELI